MKVPYVLIVLCLFAIGALRAATHEIASADQLKTIMESGKLAAGDTIVWADGEYTDQEIKLDGVHGTKAQPITLRAATPGGVVLLGESRISIGVQWWVIDGFHFDGREGKFNSYNSVEFRGRKNVGAQHVRLTHCAMTKLIAEDSSSKWIQLYGRHNTIEHCHFSGKTSKGALITVELGYLKDDETAEHRIAWNHFAEFSPQEGTDNEVIRVGASFDQHKPATCLIERNYFFRCNGENEIISNKSSFNTFRSNTFRQCDGALVLRHGHHARVEGNYFFGDGASNAGGIRITDSHHVVINNYMQDLTGTTWNAAFSILGGKQRSGGSDNGYQAVDDIVVAHNSIIHCKRSLFLNDAKGSRAPTGLIANNLIVSNSAPLILDELSSEKLKWEGNLFHGASVGASVTAITSDPQLKQADGLWRPDLSGSTVDLPAAVVTDILGQTRSKTAATIGALEVPNTREGDLLLPLKPDDVGVGFLNHSDPTGQATPLE